MIRRSFRMSLKKGKIADLVILSENPLENIEIKKE